MCLFRKNPKDEEKDKARKFCPECGKSLLKEVTPIKADSYTGEILKTKVTIYCDECVEWDDVPIAKHVWSWKEEKQPEK